MGSGQKKKGINMGTPPHKESDWVPYRWCVKNNISISAKAKNKTEWYVDIINNGKLIQARTRTVKMRYG